LMGRDRLAPITASPCLDPRLDKFMFGGARARAPRHCHAESLICIGLLFRCGSGNWSGHTLRFPNLHLLCPSRNLTLKGSYRQRGFSYKTGETAGTGRCRQAGECGGVRVSQNRLLPPNRHIDDLWKKELEGVDNQ
jgi:hypothetical protein